MTSQLGSPNSKNLIPTSLEERDDATPTLGDGVQGSQYEPSPLEQLIARTTSDSAAADLPFLQEEPTQTRTTRFSPRAQNHKPLPPRLGSTTISIVAGSLCLVQIGLVWASFLSDAWFDTHLVISAAFSVVRNETSSLQTESTFDFVSDQSLHKTTLASILSMFLGANQPWLAMTLVLTCLIFPCLSMILVPTWIIEDCHMVTKPPAKSTEEILGFSPRSFLQYFLVRTTFLAFFLLLVIDIGTSSLSMENNHTEISVTNRVRGGLVCYTLGMVCAMASMGALRFASLRPWSAPPPAPSPRFPLQYTRRSTPRAPPPSAFQDMYEPLLTSDSASIELPPPIGDYDCSLLMHPTKLPFWRKALVYEFGILATILWIPALFLPLFRITFTGLLSSFMDEVSFVVPFYQLPSVFWERGMTAGTERWVLVSLGQTLLLLVYIFPLAATVAAVWSWLISPKSQKGWFLRCSLRLLQPCLCGVIFSLSLLVSVAAFEPLVDYVLEDEIPGVCRRFHIITDTSCLSIYGQHGIGQWFLLAQSISLEILVLLTLSWNK